MKFIFLDQSAVSEVISDRVLQAVSFEQGAQLAASLKSGAPPASISTTLHFVKQSDGLYILTRTPTDNQVVFDLVQCPLFRDYPPDRCLLIFQRALRFTMKLWKNLRLSPCEHVIAESKKAVLFPFPLTTHSSFRIVLERDPTLRKAVATNGQVMLVFRAGIEDNLGADTPPDTRIAVQALTGLVSARGQVSLSVSQAGPPDQSQQLLRVTDLETRTEKGLQSLAFPQWLRRLTSVQRKFVLNQVSGPERIQGPAGTGKTLCLILKCLHTLHSAAQGGEEHHAIFIAHSEATRRAIAQVFSSLDERHFSSSVRVSSKTSLEITTLQVWCAELLKERLSETELLDYDALSSKELQLLHVLQAFQETRDADLASHRRLLSSDFLHFLDAEDQWRIAEMLRHEIGVAIKGRAKESWELYRQLEPLRYNLPLRSDADRGFVYAVFAKYKARLEQSGHFDTDDIVLTAHNQLDTPIWRRRRIREGYDSLFIDETHLFNINELMLFHHLTRAEDRHPIVFSIDRSQAIGDRGLSSQTIGQALTDVAPGATDSALMETVFRCAPQIVNVAQAVTASGATLFTNFHDPLANVASAFSGDEEAKSETPRYLPIPAGDFPEAAFNDGGSPCERASMPASSCCHRLLFARPLQELGHLCKGAQQAGGSS